jgi:TPR repeat protein
MNGLGIDPSHIDEVKRAGELSEAFSSVSGVPKRDILELAAIGELDALIAYVEKNGTSGVAQWMREQDEEDDAAEDDDDSGSDLTSEYNLGVSYLKAPTIPGNLHMAYQTFLSAAQKGHAGAQHNLAVMFNTGTYVNKDPASAASWFARAAENGHAGAAYNLSHMYLTGSGVEQSNQNAHLYLCMAADRGHPAALEYVHQFLASKGLDKNGKPLQ